MRWKPLISSLVIAAVVWGRTGPASAQDGAGQNPQTSADASTGPGVVNVSVGESWIPPLGSKWSSEAGQQPSGASGVVDPNQPYGCTYTVEPPAVQQLLGSGGPGPGQWVLPYCRGPGVIDPLPPVWAANGQPPAPPVAAVNPALVGQQAVSKLVMASPAIEMAPPAGAPQLVTVPAWLWLGAGGWQDLSATATTGPVTATATATPTKVVWDMGDGQSVTCDGPGVAYNPGAPNASTSCSHAWSRPGDYQVTATVYWQVGWTATGAPGGGNLGVLAGPPAHAGVRVTESQAVNTPTGSG